MAIFSSSQQPAGAPLTLRDAAPKWAAISDKLTELCAREQQIFDEMKPLQAALSKYDDPLKHDLNAPAPTKEPEPIRASQAAASLLGDLTLAPKVIPAFVAPAPVEVAKLRELNAELHAVREAIELLRSPAKGERHSPLAQAHLEGSKEFCAAIDPEYSAVSRAYFDALVSLGGATVAYNDFVKQRLTGVAFEYLRPIWITPGMGDPLDPASEIRRALTWAAECGRFDLASLPQRLEADIAGDNMKCAAA